MGKLSPPGESVVETPRWGMGKGNHGALVLREKRGTFWGPTSPPSWLSQRWVWGGQWSPGGRLYREKAPTCHLGPRPTPGQALRPGPLAATARPPRVPHPPCPRPPPFRLHDHKVSPAPPCASNPAELPGAPGSLARSPPDRTPGASLPWAQPPSRSSPQPVARRPHPRSTGGGRSLRWGEDLPKV